jgi:CheY-like chemotaxis protein
MLNILIVSRDETSMSAFKAGLEKKGGHTTWAESGHYGLYLMAERDFDLVVADENLGDMTGLEFTKAVIALKPMVNCAAVSLLMPDDFHEASEGLGILMQLPVNPGYESAEELLERFNKVSDLTVGVSR